MSQLRSLLMSKKFFESHEEVDKFLEDHKIEDGSMIQKIILSKTVFKTQAEVAEWADNHFFLIDDIEEMKTSFEVMQVSPELFVDKSLIEIELRRGVVATVGRLKPIMGEMIFFKDEKKNKLHGSLKIGNTYKFSEGLPSVIQIARVVSGNHGQFGPVEITDEILNSFTKNFKENVVGVDISIDYDHETREAAGWIMSVFRDPIDSELLLAEVKWTPKGALALSDREFRYYSPEFSLNYVHPLSGVEHGPTLLGGALVNRPFLKMDPIIELKNNNDGGPVMETISLKDHTAKVNGLEKEVSDIKLSEAGKVTEIAKLKEENKTFSEDNAKLKAEKAKTEKDAKHALLFSENKINAAQKKALDEGKDLYDVLALSEKLNPAPKGGGGEGDTITLSEDETKMCKELGLTKEEFVEGNK